MLFIGNRGKSGILTPEMVSVLVFVNFRVSSHPQSSSSCLIYICILSTISHTASLFSCLSYQISGFPLRTRKRIGVSLDFSESDKMAVLYQPLKAAASVPAPCLVSAAICFQIAAFLLCLMQFLICL